MISSGSQIHSMSCKLARVCAGMYMKQTSVACERARVRRFERGCVNVDTRDEPNNRETHKPWKTEKTRVTLYILIEKTHEREASERSKEKRKEGRNVSVRGGVSTRLTGVGCQLVR